MQTTSQQLQKANEPAAARVASEATQTTGQSADWVRVAQRAAYAAGMLSPGDMLALQRTIGNRATGRFAQQRDLTANSTTPKPNTAPIQQKLTVGPASDQHEQEADRLGNEEEGNEQIQTKPLAKTSVVPQTSGGVIRDVLQRAPKSQVVKELSTKLPLIQSKARLVDTHYYLASSYVDLSTATTDIIRTKLEIFSTNYAAAYGSYAGVIGAGRAEAQNQTLWRGIFLGIATGVLAGIAAAYIAPSTAGTWFSLTLADAGTAAGSSFLQGTASAVIALAFSDAMTVRGSDLQSGSLSPDVLKSNIWQHVSTMYRGALQTNRVLANLHRNSVILEQLAAEMRVQIAGGASRYSAEDILKSANVMDARINGMTSVFDELRQKTEAFKTTSSSVSAYDPKQPNVDQLEKDIWIMWMGSLQDDDSDILDLDAIENHLKQIGILGSGGVLGVDFEAGDTINYTSKEDELRALTAARSRAKAIRAQYETIDARWASPSPGVAQP